LKDFLKALEVDVMLTGRDGDYAESRTKVGQFEKAKRDLQAAVRDFENVTSPAFNTLFFWMLC
jgi:hypothetical protein